MSRLSFRPRPLDIHKKLPIVKSVKEFEDNEAVGANSTAGASTRNSLLFWHSAAEVDSEAHLPPSRKNSQEIPTPQCSVVESYERDYARTFPQPTSYLRSRGARTDFGEFVEYDLDNDDEDWLDKFNNERKILTPEKFETILFKLEVLDHKTREKAGAITPTFGSPIPILLQLEAAVEALQSPSIRFTVLQSVYNYWKAKRERWQKPILRRLQPPPPVNDTNPYNVFRPREKAHRLHTRRMQRRENKVQSFEKLRQVRRNLGQAQIILDALIKREEKKRVIIQNEVSLQRIQIKYKNEAQLIEDDFSSKFGSSDDDLMDSDDTTNAHSHARPAAVHPMCFADFKPVMSPTVRIKRELNQRPLPNGWHRVADPLEPVFLFTRPLEPQKLAAIGIVPPPDPPVENGSLEPPYRFHGRVGRGGRIVFDRWNPVIQQISRIRSTVPIVSSNSRPAP